MKKLVLITLVVGLILTSGILNAVTGVYNETVQIVNSSGVVQDPGTASATSASYNATVRVVNSSGLVVDSFGANLASPGPIGGTTPSTAEFTVLGLGVAPAGALNQIQFPTTANNTGGSAPAYIANNGSAMWYANTGGSVNFLSVGATMSWSNGSFTLNADNGVTTLPRMPLTFPITAVAATTTTQWGEQKVVKALTIENIVLSVGAFTCSGNPVVALKDCSATVGTCTPVATIGTSGTISAIGNADITVSTPNVAAGEYLAVQFNSGTCTVFNGSITAMARPQ